MFLLPLKTVANASPLRKKYIVVVAPGLQLVLIYMGRVDSLDLIFSLDTCLLWGMGGSF